MSAIISRLTSVRFMTGMGPVIQRELREGARRPFNYWLRVGGAGGALGVLMIIYSAFEMPAGSGMMAFTRLHTLLLLLIWWMVPAMTCDCIAREKRDGTLGLLFMTPLTAGGIVAGKSLVQGFRAFTLWLAAIPVLTVPFLMGGIGWLDISTAASLEFSATVLCLAAGLLASSLTKNRTAAFFMAMGLATLLLYLMGVFLSMMFIQSSFAPTQQFIVGRGGSRLIQTVFSLNWLLFVLTGLNLHDSGFVGNQEGWSAALTVLKANRFSTNNHLWPYLLSGCVGLSLLTLALVIAFAAACIRRLWKDQPPSLRQANLIKLFCTPLFQRKFSRKMNRVMDRNPIAWLQQYSWKAGVSKWGLCFGFIAGESLAITANIYSPQGFIFWQIVFLIILALVFTFIGINSFMIEKQSGALELILITPLRVEQIIFGRALGLWKLFLPAALVLAGTAVANYWLVLEAYNGDYWGDALRVGFFCAAGFFNLPVFATYFALRVKNLIVAGTLTWIALFIAPIFGLVMVDFLSHWLWETQPSETAMFLGVFLGNGGFAALTCFMLRHSLSRRIYSF